MRRTTLAPVAATLIIAGCAGETPKSELRNHAALRPRPVCSRQDFVELATRIGQRWPGQGDFELRCAGGRFPEPGLFVEARWSTVRRVGIVGTDRDREIVSFTELPADRFVHPIMRKFFVADLDGNGIDEVGDAWRDEVAGTSADQLILWTTDGTRLERVEGPHLSAYRAGLGSCHARVTVGTRAIAITVQSSSSDSLSPTECLRAGRHRFVMRDGRLVKFDGPDKRTPPPPPPAPSIILDRLRS